MGELLKGSLLKTNSKSRNVDLQKVALKTYGMFVKNFKELNYSNPPAT